MFISTGAKLKAVRKALNLNQEQLSEALGITQATCSYLEGRDTNLNKKYIDVLHETYGVNPYYWVDDEAAMFTHATAEPVVAYTSANRWAEGELIRRLNVAVNKYLDESSTTVTELAPKLSISYSHFKNMLNGNRELSMQALIGLARYANISPNYIIAAEGDMYLGNSTPNTDILKQLSDLTQQVQRLTGAKEKRA